jgi:hypothetical protein
LPGSCTSIAVISPQSRRPIAIEVQEPGKRGRRRRKSKNRSLQVDTGGGQASFELVGLSDEETAEHLEPLLSRLRASGALARG